MTGNKPKRHTAVCMERSLSLREAADFLGVAPEEILSLGEAKQLAVYGTGPAAKVSLFDLTDLLDRRRYRRSG